MDSRPDIVREYKRAKAFRSLSPFGRGFLVSTYVVTAVAGAGITASLAFRSVEDFRNSGRETVLFPVRRIVPFRAAPAR